MRRAVFLSLLLLALTARCAPVPIQPEPLPPAPEDTVVPRPAQVEGAPQPPVPQPRFHVHEVRWPGETLSHIALWYTGTGENWDRIAAANPGLKPRSINVGDRILIPEVLLKTRKPMPRDFIRSLVSPKGPAPASPMRPNKDRGTEELFEPVEVLSPPASSEKSGLYGPVDLLQAPPHSGPSSGQNPAPHLLP